MVGMINYREELATRRVNKRGSRFNSRQKARKYSLFQNDTQASPRSVTVSGWCSGVCEGTHSPCGRA
jgi:hypothetical protein